MRLRWLKSVRAVYLVMSRGVVLTDVFVLNVPSRFTLQLGLSVCLICEMLNEHFLREGQKQQ